MITTEFHSRPGLSWRDCLTNSHCAHFTERAKKAKWSEVTMSHWPSWLNKAGPRGRAGQVGVGLHLTASPFSSRANCPYWPSTPALCGRGRGHHPPFVQHLPDYRAGHTDLICSHNSRRRQGWFCR